MTQFENALILLNGFEYTVCLCGRYIEHLDSGYARSCESCRKCYNLCRTCSTKYHTGFICTNCKNISEKHNSKLDCISVQVSELMIISKVQIDNANTINERLNELKDDFNDHDNRLDGLDMRIRLQVDIDTVDRLVNDLDTRIEVLKKESKEQDIRLDNLDKRITDLLDQTKQLNDESEFDRNARRIKAWLTKNELENIPFSISELESNIINHHDEYNRKFDLYEQQFKTQSDQIQMILNMIHNHTDQLDCLLKKDNIQTVTNKLNGLHI